MLIDDMGSADGDEARELRRHYDALMVRVQVAHPELGTLMSSVALGSQAVQEALDKETTLISYFVVYDHLIIWIVDADRVEMVMNRVEVTPRELVTAYRAEISSRGRNRGVDSGDGVRGIELRHQAPSISKEMIYDTVFRPIEGKIRTSKIVIVPHGPLHYLPFAALWNAESQRHLVQDYTISLLPSASALALLQAKETPIRGNAFVMGDPRSSMEPLPWAGVEAENVAHRMGSRLLVGAYASESALREFSGEVDLLHIAAHGVLDPDAPRFSYLQLAEDSAHDGRLHMFEVFEDLDLREANLVVLSACQTALGQGAGGDEIVGLIRAFLYAGAPAVVATLWPVEDRSTQELMELFYEQLHAGAAPVDAFSSAQLEVRKNPATSHPYHWAGFSLVGIADQPVGMA